MKISILAFLALFFTVDLTAQVIFRNDFVINRKQRKIENLGISYVTINLGRFPNWNQLLNGRGGRTMVLDVRALTQKETDYSYTELAERVYTPPMFGGPIIQKVPMYLLMAPPGTQYPLMTYKGLNMNLKPKLKFGL